MQRVDRNLEEMTGELRVVVTGVQVLFAFLLIVPFNAGFVGVGPFERGVYFVTLLCSVFAALCTIAPAAYHRAAVPRRRQAPPRVPRQPPLDRGPGVPRAGDVRQPAARDDEAVRRDGGHRHGRARGGAVRRLWFVAPLLRRARREPAAGERAAAPEDRAPAAPAPIEREPADPGQWGKALRYDAGVGAQEHLRVDARRTDERVVLRLTGELDLASSPIFERALEDADVASAPLLVLDLDELKFVDSTGLRSSCWPTRARGRAGRSSRSRRARRRSSGC